MNPLKATVVATCLPPDTKNLLFCVKTAEATNVVFVRQKNQLWRFPLFEVEFLFLIASGWWEEVKEVDDDDGQPLRRRDTARSWWWATNPLCWASFEKIMMLGNISMMVGNLWPLRRSWCWATSPWWWATFCRDLFELCFLFSSYSCKTSPPLFPLNPHHPSPQSTIACDRQSVCWNAQEVWYILKTLGHYQT